MRYWLEWYVAKMETHEVERTLRTMK
jgi:hypothetical protein